MQGVIVVAGCGGGGKGWMINPCSISSHIHPYLSVKYMSLKTDA